MTIKSDSIYQTLAKCAGIKAALLCPDWDTLKQQHLNIRCYLGRAIGSVRQDHIRLVNGSTIDLFAGDSVNDFCGRRYHLVFIRGPVSDKIFNEVIRPAVAASISEEMNGGPLYARGIYHINEN